MKLVIRAGISYIAAIVIAYTVCAAIGFLAVPEAGAALAAADARAALAFAFRDEVAAQADWHATRGTVKRGWFLRRAFAEGQLGDPSGIRYSEQVLKSGWPFTTVRGFVRVIDRDVRREGAFLLQADATNGPVRLLQLQPVWPGMLINSLPIAAALLGLDTVRRIRAT